MRIFATIRRYIWLFVRLLGALCMLIIAPFAALEYFYKVLPVYRDYPEWMTWGIFIVILLWIVAIFDTNFKHYKGLLSDLFGKNKKE